MLVHESNQPPTNFNDSGDTSVLRDHFKFQNHQMRGRSNDWMIVVSPTFFPCAVLLIRHYASRMKKKIPSVIGLVFFLLATVIKAEDFDFDAVKSKSDEKQSETLVFKGFYLGMPIEDAQGLINHYMGLKQYAATPVVIPDSQAADPAADAMAQAFLGALNQMGVANEDKTTSYKVFKKNDQLVLSRNIDRPFAIADADGKVLMFELSKDVRNKLFSAADMPIKELLKTFMKAYDIPIMEPEEIKLMASLYGGQHEAGIQSILRHRSPKGFEFTYHDKVVWNEEGAQVFASYIPEGHIAIKIIESAIDRESKFD